MVQIKSVSKSSGASWAAAVLIPLAILPVLVTGAALPEQYRRQVSDSSTTVSTTTTAQPTGGAAIQEMLKAFIQKKKQAAGQEEASSTSTQPSTPEQPTPSGQPDIAHIIKTMLAKKKQVAVGGQQSQSETTESSTTSSSAAPAATENPFANILNKLKAGQRPLGGSEKNPTEGAPAVNPQLAAILSKLKGAGKQSAESGSAPVSAEGANPLAAILSKLKSASTAGNSTATSPAPAGMAELLAKMKASGGAAAQQAPTPANDACGRVNKMVQEAVAKKQSWISGAVAYECLASVPFNSTRSVEVVQKLAKFLTTYSAQAFFLDPPTPELGMNPVDLPAQLEIIEKRASKENGYPNDYAFNVELMELFSSFNDGHVMFMPYCARGVFQQFYHDYPVIALSKEADTTPEIYLVDPETHEIGEQVKVIDGEPAHQHLLRLVEKMNDLHWIDPDARYNDLLFKRAQRKKDVKYGTFAMREIYYEDSFIMETVSGKEITVEWKVDISRFPLQKVYSTESLLKNVCLPQDPMANLTPEQIKQLTEAKKKQEQAAAAGNSTTATTSSQKATSSEAPAASAAPASPQNITAKIDDGKQSVLPQFVPNESDLGDGTYFPYAATAPWWPKSVARTNGSEFTVHVVDSETAVFAIHSFENYAPGKNKVFGPYWQQAIDDAKKALMKHGVKRLIFDLSDNGGGTLTLGLNTFRQFFPDSTAFYGQDARSSPLGDVLLKSDNMTYLRKEDGTPFSGVEEFLKPVEKFGDKFTAKARWDPSNFIGKELALTPEQVPKDNFLPIENVVFLTDGRCGSTCAVFAEALSFIGVKSVAVGGRPFRTTAIRPMQAIGGIKGTEMITYSYSARRQKLAPEIVPGPLPIQAEAAVNYRNSYAPGEDLPLEFVYQTADYRIMKTPEMFKNPAKIWETARSVVWDESGKQKESMFKGGKKGVKKYFYQTEENKAAAEERRKKFEEVKEKAKDLVKEEKKEEKQEKKKDE